MSEQAMLHEAIRTASDPVKVLRRIVEGCLTLIPEAKGSSLEVRVDADTLEYASCAGNLSDFVGLRLDINQSMSGLSVLSGHVERCDDARIDPRVNREACEKVGAISMLCVPLSPDQGAMAVLKVTSPKTNAFNDADAAKLEVLARFMSTAIRAASDLARVVDELGANLQAVSADAPALEQRATARFVANVMSPGLVDSIEAKALVEQIIETASIDITFQPIVNFETGKILACEAKWVFKEAPVRGSETWFDMAHRVGLGEQLELLAYDLAIEQSKALGDDVSIELGLSSKTLLGNGFRERLARLPQNVMIAIELTEHDELLRMRELNNVLGMMRAKFIRLSIDDTGVGYSSLKRIISLKPDMVKLERALVSNLDGDRIKQALIRALQEFAAEIGVRVVAEGVERAAERDALLNLGVTLGQGYLFGGAVSAALLREAIDNQ